MTAIISEIIIKLLCYDMLEDYLFLLSLIIFNINASISASIQTFPKILIFILILSFLGESKINRLCHV